MRPHPPADLLETPDERFAADARLAEWMVTTFVDPQGMLANPDHAHLEQATFGALWTTAENVKAMRTVIGQAEIMPPQGMGKWARARAVQQVLEWFGYVPDFLLTFSARAAAEMDDTEFCALVEHELYHCAQAKDAFGMPKFGRDGLPQWALRGHDVEEFVGVVARYGAVDPGVVAMVEAARRGPTVALSRIGFACGTCHLRAA